MEKENELKEVASFGVLVDGSMNEINKDGYFDRITYVEEYLGSYGIKWIHCFNNNNKVVSYNALFVAYIVWEEEGKLNE